MNLIKKISSLFVIALLVGSCADEPLPYEVFEDLGKGALARKLVDNNVSYFLTDIPGSVYTFTVEFYDDNDGNNVASFDWTVRHRNNVTGTTSDPVTMASVASSAFGRDGTSGLPTASYSFALADALAAMGLTADDVNGGDDIIFDGTITKTDGTTFGPDNSGAAIQGGAGFDGFFRLVRPLLCVSELDGACDATTVAWCGETWTGTVNFVQTGPGEYDLTPIDVDGNPQIDFSLGAYWVCYGLSQTLPGGDVKFIDACNNAGYSGVDRWSETYNINSVTVDGSTLTIDWFNSYSPEAGVTTLVRQDGNDWPPLK